MTDSTKKCGILFREGEVLLREDGERAVDFDARTVDIAFSSEHPVERWFGTEILDHSPSSVRLGRMKNNGPILVDHNRSDHVGVVKSVSIDADRRGRATVRFGTSERAKEIFQDVNDGIRTHISVGYRVHEWTENKDGDTRITDWEPLELSFVSIPADDSVGVGRDADSEENSVIVHRDYEDPPMPDKDPAPKVDVKEVERKAAEKARKDEQSRIREITALGKRGNQVALADKYVNDGKPLESFRIELFDVMEEARKVEDQKRLDDAKPATLLGLNDQEVRGYSLMAAIRATESGNWKGAEFERECSDHIAKELDRDAKGFFIPFDVQMGKRVMNVGSKNPNGLGPDNVGSDLVGTDHLASSFIDFLYTRSVLFQAGATALPGLVGNVDIPKQAGTAGFNWLTEDEDNADDDIATGVVQLSPTTVAGSVPMTRRLIKQSSPAVEGLVMNDLARGAALTIDLAAIQGSGTGAIPTGVMNQAGVGVNTLAVPGAPDWTELVKFETLMDSDDALMGALAYITTPGIVGYLKSTPKVAGQAIYMADSDRRSGVSGGIDVVTNGYSTRRRTGLAANTLVFGNWSDVLIGMWGVLDVMVDTATKAKSGGLVIRVFQDIDVAIRHPESFVKANLV